ncbi:MAG: hypothetical protein PWP65_961 [Clostridia bacterium]|nr:hypothetical protein [Clostridia bacterium]
MSKWSEIRQKRLAITATLAAVALLILSAAGGYAAGKEKGLKAGYEMAIQVVERRPQTQTAPQEPETAVASSTQTQEPEKQSQPDLISMPEPKPAPSPARPTPTPEPAPKPTAPEPEPKKQPDKPVVDATLDRIEHIKDITILSQGKPSVEGGTTEDDWVYIVDKVPEYGWSDVAVQPKSEGTVFKVSTGGSATIDAIKLAATVNASDYAFMFTDEDNTTPWGKLGIRLDAATEGGGPWITLKNITIRQQNTYASALLPPELRKHSTLYLRITPTGDWKKRTTLRSLEVGIGRLNREHYIYRDEVKQDEVKQP